MANFAAFAAARVRARVVPILARCLLPATALILSASLLQACGEGKGDAARAAGGAARSSSGAAFTPAPDARPLQMMIQVYEPSADPAQPPLRLFRAEAAAPGHAPAWTEIPLQAAPEGGDVSGRRDAALSSIKCGMKWAGRCYQYNPPCSTSCN